MTTRKKFDRKRLREIVESYGGNLRMFDDLQSSCYEQALAAHSLEQLDLFYSELFMPGRSLRKVCQSCPPWPPGAPFAGRQPKPSALDEVRKRFRTERCLGDLSGFSATMEHQKRAALELPVEEQRKLLDDLLTRIGRASLQSLLEGRPVSEQLPPVDRLIKGQKLVLQEKDAGLKEKKLNLEQKKFRSRKKSEKAEKGAEHEAPVTKEFWEQMEKELHLL